MFTLEKENMHWQWYRSLANEQILQMELAIGNKLMLYPSVPAGKTIALDPSVGSITIGGVSVLTQSAGDGRYAPYSMGLLQLDGNNPQKIAMKDSSLSDGGSSLEIAAGGSRMRVPDENGGTLILSGGAARGGGGSIIRFQTASPTQAGQRSLPITHMQLTHTGALGLGSGALTANGWGSFKELDVSWGGIPATLILGADTNQTSRTNNTTKWGTIAVPHYNTSQRPVGALTVRSYNGNNAITLGGGTDNTAATIISLTTGETSTTYTGTSRVRIQSNGALELGTGASALNRVDTVALGYNSIANAAEAIALGANAKARGMSSIAAGPSSEANQTRSTAVGTAAISSGEASMAAGFSTASVAKHSTALGVATIANGYGQTVLGVANEATGNATNPLLGESEILVVGNGSYEWVNNAWVSTRSNAMTVKRNGNTWIKGDLKVDGVLRVKPAGDIDMGAFTAGQQ